MHALNRICLILFNIIRRGEKKVLRALRRLAVGQHDPQHEGSTLPSQLSFSMKTFVAHVKLIARDLQFWQLFQLGTKY